MFDFVEIPAPEKKKTPSLAPSAKITSVFDRVNTRDPSVKLNIMPDSVTDEEKKSVTDFYGTYSSDSEEDLCPSIATPTTCPPPSATIPSPTFVADYCDRCRGRFEYPLKQYDTPLGVRQLCGACHKGE